MQPLKFVVVGGSIAGLACAFALQRAGHQVLVLEQTDGKRRVSVVFPGRRRCFAPNHANRAKAVYDRHQT